MPKRYPREVIENAQALSKNGMSRSDIAIRLGVPKTTLQGWIAYTSPRKRYAKLVQVSSVQGRTESNGSLEHSLAAVRDEMLEIASQLDSAISHIAALRTVGAALEKAITLKGKARILRDEIAQLESRLVERAMVVHSAD